MYAFIHIHKSGGTTIKSILRRSFGLRHFDDGPLRERSWMTAADLRRTRWIYPKLTSIAGHRVRPFTDLHEAAPGLRYFSFLRDPVKLNFSTFRALLADGRGQCGYPDSEAELRASFLRLVEEKSNWQTRRLTNTSDSDMAIQILRERVSFVGVTERFDESLVMLRRWMQDADLRIAYRPLNISDKRLERNPWASESPERLARIRDFLDHARHDARLLQAIRAANQHDLRLYDHVLNAIYPAQQTDFGSDLAAELQRFGTRQKISPIQSQDAWTGKAYRNLVVKPLAPWLFLSTAGVGQQPREGPLTPPRKAA